jgi:hypothetical protein
MMISSTQALLFLKLNISGSHFFLTGIRPPSKPVVQPLTAASSSSSAKNRNVTDRSDADAEKLPTKKRKGDSVITHKMKKKELPKDGDEVFDKSNPANSSGGQMTMSQNLVRKSDEDKTRNNKKQLPPKKRKASILDSDSEELWSEGDVSVNNESGAEDSDTDSESKLCNRKPPEKRSHLMASSRSPEVAVARNETKYVQMVFPKQGGSSFLRLVRIESCGTMDEMDLADSTVEILL